MNKNNFEKQVSEKLQDLTIPPDGNSWVAIESRLNKHKKRRWGIIYFIIFALIIGGSTVMWLAVREKNNQVTVNTSLKLIGSTEKNKQLKNKNNGSVQQEISISIQKETNIPSVSHPEKEAVRPNKIKMYGSQQLMDLSPEKNLPARIHIAGNMPDTFEENKGVRHPARGINIVEKRDFGLHTNKLTSAPTTLLLSEELSSGNLINEKIDMNKKDSVTGKWHLSSHVSAGVFTMGKPFNTVASSNLAYDPGINLPAGAWSMPRFSVGRQIQYGFGLDMARKISKRGSVSFGLSYRHYSFTIFSKDSLLQSNKDEHHNALHYLAIPINYRLAINPLGKIPLFWSAGISPGYMINADAWLPSTSGNFVKDKSYFSRLNLGISTDVSVQIISKNTIQILVGPYVQYNITTLASDGLYKDKHLSSAGIKAEILFSKKQ